MIDKFYAQVCRCDSGDRYGYRFVGVVVVLLFFSAFLRGMEGQTRRIGTAVP